MKSLLFIIMMAVLFMTVAASPAHAAGNIAGHSALLAAKEMKAEDPRVAKLRAYLEDYNSPLAPYAEVFITEADANNLDWKFVVSIAGVESGYGKRIPVNSYNGWGWGIYGGKVTRFASWDEGIQTVTRDLRGKYMNKWGAETIDEIGAIYAANPHWSARVQSFMTKLEAYEPKNLSLPISI